MHFRQFSKGFYFVHRVQPYQFCHGDKKLLTHMGEDWDLGSMLQDHV